MIKAGVGIGRYSGAGQCLVSIQYRTNRITAVTGIGSGDNGRPVGRQCSGRTGVTGGIHYPVYPVLKNGVVLAGGTDTVCAQCKGLKIGKAAVGLFFLQLPDTGEIIGQSNGVAASRQLWRGAVNTDIVCLFN